MLNVEKECKSVLNVEQVCKNHENVGKKCEKVSQKLRKCVNVECGKMCTLLRNWKKYGNFRERIKNWGKVEKIWDYMQNVG